MTIDASALTGGLRLNGNGRVVEVPSGVTATLRALTLQNGYDISQGGGVYNAGALTLDRCTISNNGGSGESITPQGGGVYNAGNLIVDQCTITANRARSGSGIYSPDGTALTIRHSTIAGNESEVGTAGIRNNGALTLFNSIVAGNNGSGLSPNFYEGGTVVRSGSNLTDGDPQLLPLGNYGGPTQTMPPSPGSPAKDQGGIGGPAFATDQRGFPRVIGTAVDIGAVEEIPGGTLPGATLDGIWQSDTDRDGQPSASSMHLAQTRPSPMPTRRVVLEFKSALQTSLPSAATSPQFRTRNGFSSAPMISSPAVSPRSSGSTAPPAFPPLLQVSSEPLASRIHHHRPHPFQPRFLPYRNGIHSLISAPENPLHLTHPWAAFISSLEPWVETHGYLQGSLRDHGRPTRAIHQARNRSPDLWIKPRVRPPAFPAAFTRKANF